MNLIWHKLNSSLNCISFSSEAFFSRLVYKIENNFKNLSCFSISLANISENSSVFLEKSLFNFIVSSASNLLNSSIVINKYISSLEDTSL